MGQYLKVDRVDSGVVRRCVLFRVIGAIRVVVNIRQRATRPELIPQVNVQVFAAGLRWTGAGTLHGQRSLQYPGSRGTGTHRAARRVDLSRSIVRIGHQLDRFLWQTISCLSTIPNVYIYPYVRATRDSCKRIFLTFSFLPGKFSISTLPEMIKQ